MGWVMNPEEMSAVVEAAKLFKIAHDEFVRHRDGGNGVLWCPDCRILGVLKCLNGGKELNEQAIVARKNLFAVLDEEKK